MTVNTYLPRSEVMANWSYQLMRIAFKVVDIFKNPAKRLDDFDIKPGWNVIDYGCGPGRYLRKASEQVGPEGKVFAVDIHEIAINCAYNIVEKYGLDNVYPVKAQDYFVPIQENTADLIYVLDVFHMISQPTLFLQELHRLVKKSGKLILEDGHQKREKTILKVKASKWWKIIEEDNKQLVLKPIYKVF